MGAWREMAGWAVWRKRENGDGNGVAVVMLVVVCRGNNTKTVERRQRSVWETDAAEVVRQDRLLPNTLPPTPASEQTLLARLGLAARILHYSIGLHNQRRTKNQIFASPLTRRETLTLLSRPAFATLRTPHRA